MTATQIKALFLTLMLVIGLVGCGKTGPLYLPSDQVVLAPTTISDKPSLFIRNND